MFVWMMLHISCQQMHCSMTNCVFYVLVERCSMLFALRTSEHCTTSDEFELELYTFDEYSIMNNQLKIAIASRGQIPIQQMSSLTTTKLCNIAMQTLHDHLHS